MKMKISQIRLGKFHDIRLQIALPYILLILLTMLGLGVYTSSFLNHTYLQFFEDELVSKANLVAEIISPYFVDNTSSEQLDNYAANWAYHLGTRLTILDKNGNVLGDSQIAKEELTNQLNYPEIINATKKGIGSDTRYSEILGDEFFFIAIPVIQESEIAGYIRLSMPISTIKSHIFELQRTLALITLVITVIAITLALWISDRTMSPLKELTRTAGRISG